MKSPHVRFSFGLLAAHASLSLSGWAQELQFGRFEILPGSPPSCRTDFRGVKAEDVMKAEGLVDGKIIAPAEFVPWSPSQGRSAVLFLLDVSDVSRSSEVEAGRKLLEDVLQALPPKDFEAAVATAGQGMRMISDLGANPSARAEALAKLKAESCAAEIYRSVKAGLDRLAQASNGRSALVLLSDGKSEDKDPQFQPDPIIDLAKKRGVAIFSVGYAATQKDTTEWQSMRRIAEATGGVFLETQPGSANVSAPLANGADLGKTLMRVMQSGGTASFPLGNTAEGRHMVGVKITLTDGREPLTLEKSALIPPQPGGTAPTKPEVPVTAEEAAPTTQKPESIPPTAAPVPSPPPVPEPKPTWLEENRGLATGLGAVLVALIAVLVILLMRLLKSEPPAPPTTPTAPAPLANLPNPFLEPSPAPLDETPAAADSIPYAWLEELEGGQRRYPLAKNAVRIGRSADSEVRFENDSVSSHHAEIIRHRDKSMVVTDLKSSNGVLVNGKRIEQCVLKDDDVLEIGEIKLRLVLNLALN